MNEDSLARAKLQGIVSGRESFANPSRDARKSYVHDNLVIAINQFSPNNLKEYIFGLRNYV